MDDMESGEIVPDFEFYAKAAEMGFDVVYVITGTRASNKIKRSPPSHVGVFDAILLPLLSATGRVTVSSELITEDVNLGKVPISEKWLHAHLPHCQHKALEVMRLYDDNMACTLNVGDYLIVDKNTKRVDIDGIYVFRINAKYFVKRITHTRDGVQIATSDNPNVRSIELLPAAQHALVFGLVVYAWSGRCV